MASSHSSRDDEEWHGGKEGERSGSGGLQPQISGGEEDVLVQEMQKELGSIFLFSSPQLYYQVVEFSLLLQCLYIAIWLTNLG